MGNNGRPQQAFAPRPAPAEPDPPGISQQVPLQRVQTHVGFQQVPSPDGHLWTLMQIQTPSGVQCYFLTADECRALADELHKLAQAGNLYVPPSTPGGILTPG